GAMTETGTAEPRGTRRRLATALAALRAPSRRPAWVAGTLLCIIVGLSAWLRAPGFTQGGFASHDVAGMLHEAMLIHDGALPYVDSIELKAPGTFWLAAWLAGPDGTDIATFQIWANLWALATLGVVAA